MITIVYLIQQQRFLLQAVFNIHFVFFTCLYLLLSLGKYITFTLLNTLFIREKMCVDTIYSYTARLAFSSAIHLKYQDLVLYQYS